MQDRRILIAEDDEDLREALEFYLSQKGYTVACVPDGVSALDELGRGGYDLLLTDLVMPGMTGDDLIANLDKARIENPPAVIVMTGMEKGDQTVKAIKAGVSFFLRKPLNMDELEAAVATSVDRLRLERELKLQYRELDRKVEARTRELTLLNRFSSAVNRSFDLGCILDDAVGYLLESMEADAAWIYLKEEDQASLRLKASKGFPDELKNKLSFLDVSKGYTGRTFNEGEAFIYGSPPGESVPIGGTVASFGFNTAMHAAIKSGESVLGTMGVASKTGHEFQDSHLQLLASFGNQIGVAVEKISLYEKERAASRDLQKKVNQLVILNELGSMVRVSRTLEDAAISVVNSVGDGLGFDAACLWLMDEDGRSLTLSACHGIPEPPTGVVVEADERLLAGISGAGDDASMLSECFCSRIGGNMPLTGGVSGCSAIVPLVVRNPKSREISCWEYFGCSEKDCPAYLNSLACWMVEDSCVRKLKGSGTLLDKLEMCKGCEVYVANRKGRVIGLMCVERRGGADALGADDLRTLGVYANSIAASLENIRLMQRLIKDERFIDNILFNMSSGLMVTDNDGVVRMINYSGATIFRLEHDELIGRNILDIFPEAGKLIAVENNSVGHEVIINTRDGEVPVGYTNSRLIEHEGSSDGVIVVFRDLSELKKLQDRIRAADRFAAIGKVAAGVAHEIRNPLFGITSVAQILARETSDDSPLKGLIDAMLSETSRLNTLVEELLLYGRPTKAALMPTDIHALMEEVVDFHAAGINEKNISIVKEFDATLPAVSVDPHQMRQVLLNLLYNALDAIHSGGEIRLRTAVSERGVVIRISDTGIGIPQEELPKVFDLFFTTKEKGTGLGLAICRKIVEDHGGTVSIQSIMGKGTTVEILLPANLA